MFLFMQGITVTLGHGLTFLKKNYRKLKKLTNILSVFILFHKNFLKIVG